ncbi:MAG: flagellar basal body rod protein FlgB, partial [Lentisphaerota bacterium]
MDETTQVLNKMLDVSALRQRVLANNLANINTPGYKRLDVKFRDELTDAIR